MKDSVNKKNRIEAVIFDWAGTTIDYGCFAPLKGFMDGFGAKGVTITAAEARKPMGMLKLDHVRAIARMERVREAYERENGHLPKEEDIQEIYGVFKHTLMDNILSYTDVKPGVCETVDELRAGGIRIGSTSGYTREMMDKIPDRAKGRGCCPREPDSAYQRRKSLRLF